MNGDGKIEVDFEKLKKYIKQLNLLYCDIEEYEKKVPTITKSNGEQFDELNNICREAGQLSKAYSSVVKRMLVDLQHVADGLQIADWKLSEEIQGRK